jgi:four helix bundle protein
MAGVTRYEDLWCWQLANELKVGVYDIVDSTSAAHDFRFRDQLKESASSGPSNLAEAFGSYGHGDAARFARYAKASLTETHNHLCDGIDRHYWTRDRVAPLLVLTQRAIAATTGWLAHLSTTDAPDPHWKT